VNWSIGQERFVVDSRQAGFAQGRREYWSTAAEALAQAEEIAQVSRDHGLSSFAELSPSQRRDAAEALDLLDGAGTLLDAARSFLAQREHTIHLAHVPSVSEAISQYLAAKRAEETRGEISRFTIYDIQSKMRIVAAEFGALKVSELDEGAVSHFLGRQRLSPSSEDALRTKLSQLLNYCWRRKWISSNPSQNVKIRVKQKDVAILSIEEIRALLSAARAELSVAPFILVQLFGGLRPFEALRLCWDKIHFETGQIEVHRSTSKTRETRFLTMNPTLTEWFLPYRRKNGSIKGYGFERALLEVKRAAGFSKDRPWPKDVLRHCYGSYWLAVHKDRAHLAELMGTSLAMIKTHYRRAVPEAVAAEFWKLSPTDKEPAKIISINAAAS
jgi:integrase